MAYLVEKIAESVKSLGIGVSYGDPVTVDGVQIVPVALVWFGFGGGNGQTGDGEEGGGGGGGGASIPVGVYVGGSSQQRFEPNLIAMMAVAIPLTWVAGKAVAGIIRAFKK